MQCFLCACNYDAVACWRIARKIAQCKGGFSDNLHVMLRYLAIEKREGCWFNWLNCVTELRKSYWQVGSLPSDQTGVNVLSAKHEISCQVWNPFDNRHVVYLCNLFSATFERALRFFSYLSSMCPLLPSLAIKNREANI